jgi:ribonucleoside-diphosphate reductase alpha chain
MADSVPFKLDPKHESFEFFDHPFSVQIWESKYRYKGEKTINDTFKRVAEAVCIHDQEQFAQECYVAMCAGLWIPGGRILAGAGTEKRVTLMNCYVNKTIDDSLDDIMEGVSIAALTQQQGGGIGTDFSTLRPTGAVLHRTGAVASGPLPFMVMWDAMCTTIRSAGDRRGAMMGTLIDTHPDLLQFVEAKHKKGELTNFNVSILVSDAFMEAVREDEEWVLHFEVPPISRDKALEEYDFKDDDNKQQYAYAVHRARDLWAKITKSTYEYSEPGVIFIDRVNDLNNLGYCEYIQCTNPCGEQPLPPNGTCNLGAINLARMVTDPFTDKADINWELLARVASVGIRFLDNVIDVTQYPLKAQEQEESDKRRTGLGVSGLADALAQLGLRYGSPAARDVTDKIFYTICQAVYKGSIDLAAERGPFPLYSDDQYLRGFAGKKLDHVVIETLKEFGIRNGVLLTVAPTGTTSIVYGDVSSGIEPVFAHTTKRNVRQPDGSFKLSDTSSFVSRFYKHCTGRDELPGYLVTTDDLTIEDHITMQAAVQNWVDASVSKTVNCPKEMSYESFVKVYDLAYSLGCKGCTTYRPSDVRGSILIDASKTEAKPQMPLVRPDQLFGVTRKIKWPSYDASLYVTVNYDGEGNAFEVFLNCKDGRAYDWMTSTSILLTALLRLARGSAGFITTELRQVQSLHDTAFVRGPRDQNPRNYGSLVALLGAHLEDMFAPPNGHSETPKPVRSIELVEAAETEIRERSLQDVFRSQQRASKFYMIKNCNDCGSTDLIRKEGCTVCNNCGYSDCG